MSASPSPAPTPSLKGQPLRSALRPEDDSDRAAAGSSSASVKAVQIAEPEQSEPEGGLVKRRSFSAGVGKRLSGRPPLQSGDSSRTSLRSQSSLEVLDSLTSSPSPHDTSLEASASHPHHRHRVNQLGERLIAQVADWLEHERTKSQNRKSRRAHPSKRKSSSHVSNDTEVPLPHLTRRTSADSQSSEVSFDRLQRIIEEGMSALGLKSVPHYSSRSGRKPQRKRSVQLYRTASSDTEWYDGDVLVPSCDAVLDNSKTMSYSGGRSGPLEDQSSGLNERAEKERIAWITFKNEIIRLAHTLKLKGWRRVALDSGESISVERLSGALTNAVYVVCPPDCLREKTEQNKKPPAKLLLRIYGPQVDNIIDRQNELSVLQRLARKKIGPRLLGTFSNGRFEQYLNATTLTAANIREPQTSKQIAKRMRELHEGIELLDEEREAGPAVWKNWDSWLATVERAITFLDKKILSGNLGPVRGPADAWKERGLICGVEWAKFKAMVDKYRRYLDDRYGNPKIIRDHLVFAHNDTQYGNILRVRPDDTISPLMQPNYEHKQLVVIDFEYAAANMRGLEFANHFTEWGYNYHNEREPHAFNPSMYPKPDEQRRFIKAYVEHRPEYAHPAALTPNLTPLSTPQIAPTTPSLNPTTSGPSSSIVEFMLDARVPPGGWREEEKRREDQVDQQVTELMEETRLWRIANSAQWVAWGILQAKIPGYDAETAGDAEGAQLAPVGVPEEDEGDAEAFDYLGYAHSRAMFFWGDCVKMGLIRKEELPEEVRSKLKIIDY
ncbi:hypothetical protein DL766_009542 [Monosporascus sp. MC13-8B]|uniref:Choline kinase N-terminal domain-containing protein n=1 Tax=Monosporascus cannonballus TaxID=155416 RepID=A0ABY0HFF0_9PEZI|nr:hypothetical protein DL762_003185 [Monosporascus cannonballus]RYO98253.1 hypothetical protein DL763_002353 [Monosporascus cannonballus]RYP14934.1 hypothetical protein DL766_009542 [Monosporascus sp. MC13-8B]